MKLYEVIERIEFNIASNDDLSGKGINTIFSKKNIVYSLQTALDHYSQFTLGIEGIKSYSMTTTQRSVSAPPDAIRTGTYRGFFAVISDLKYLLKPEEFSRINTDFYGNAYTGIPSRVYFWENFINIFPLFNESFTICTVGAVGGISAIDTRIFVECNAGFMEYNGRIQIDNEIIEYGRFDSASGNFLDCRRGVEGTTPAEHDFGETVNGKNFYVYYYKNHWKVPLLNNSTIDPAFLDKDMEVSDDHLEGVIDEASYKLLSKVDISRADLYKRDYKEFLNSCKYELMNGRDNTRTYKSVRGQFPFEYQFVRGY
tara:strand:- start:1210 stop:2148 length:939 start_codon:yes stop_codon:yes gene_type:complete